MVEGGESSWYSSSAFHLLPLSPRFPDPRANPNPNHRILPLDEEFCKTLTLEGSETSGILPSMALNLRHKQMSLIVRLLNLNQPPNPSGGISTATGAAGTEEVYKILIMDTFCRGVLSPLIHVNELRKHGITLFFAIDKNRQTVPAIYFVRATPENIEHIAADAARGLYESFHLNFSSSLPRPLLETLASKTLEKDAVHRISKIYDQYLEFVTLEDSLFSLAQPKTYVQINDPSAGDRETEEIVEKIVSGLFCVLATLGVVPVIRCARGGPAEMVTVALDSRTRDHLLIKNNIRC